MIVKVLEPTMSFIENISTLTKYIYWQSIPKSLGLHRQCTQSNSLTMSCDYRTPIVHINNPSMCNLEIQITKSKGTKCILIPTLAKRCY